MSRLVDAPRTVAGEAPAGKLVLRTLADHRRFELTAFCAACERYAVLDHAALAPRGSGGTRRSMRCGEGWRAGGAGRAPAAC